MVMQDEGQAAAIALRIAPTCQISLVRDDGDREKTGAEMKTTVCLKKILPTAEPGVQNRVFLQPR